MYTFNKMWGVVTPQEAAERIEQQRKEAGITEPKNLEEQAISLVGTDIYEKLIKGYTQKQPAPPCNRLDYPDSKEWTWLPERTPLMQHQWALTSPPTF